MKTRRMGWMGMWLVTGRREIHTGVWWETWRNVTTWKAEA